MNGVPVLGRTGIPPRNGTLHYDYNERKKQTLQLNTNSNLKMIERKNKNKKMGTWILPQELHREILSWLPADSLVSFKSVCKAWYTLVLNDPGFVKRHLDRANAAGEHSLIGKSRGEFYQLKAPFYDTAIPLVALKDTDISAITDFSRLVGSCNGLLCFAKRISSWYGDFVVIMNPSTRSYRESPVYHSHEDYPSCGWHGFGYNSVVDDYKVVRISSSNYSNKSTEASVYSMSTNSWTRARYNLTVDFSSSTAEFLNEAFHWIGTNNQDENPIISINISDYQFRFLPAPPVSLIHIKWNKSLMILRGCLCIMIPSTIESDGDYVVWAMTEYGVQESWTRQFVITRNHFSRGMHKVFDPWTNSGNNNQLLIRHYDGYLVLYDLKKATATASCITNFRGVNCTYIPSLVSLKSKVIHAGTA